MATFPNLTSKTMRGPATSFNTTYQVDNYSYPVDIQSEQYGGNFVAFYINVSTDSYLSSLPSMDSRMPDIANRDRGGLIAQANAIGLTPDGMLATAAVSTIASGGTLGNTSLKGKGTGKIDPSTEKEGTHSALSSLWETSKMPTDWFKQAVGGAAIAKSASNATRAQKRLKTAIMLYVPNQLSIRYGTQWGEEETFNFQATLGGAEALGKAVNVSSFNIGLNTDSVSQGTSIAAAIAMRGDNKNVGAMSALTGLTANPKKEQVFKGVDFRTFSMDYQFFPRNATEAQNVLNIIKQFKLHMHPEFKDSMNFLYIYPSEFDVYYYQNGKENLNIHRHTSCVLTDMTVNYTPNGQFNTFPNGMPTQIAITLNFRELAQITKEKIEDGL
jgi:hypothetical protein